jgi:hypothetical protein
MTTVRVSKGGKEKKRLIDELTTVNDDGATKRIGVASK